MHIILSLFFSLLFGGLCAYIAAKRQRRALLWLFLGFLGGVFTLLVVLLLPTPKESLLDDPLSNWINKKGGKIVNPSPSNELVKEWSSREWYYVDDKRRALGPISISKLQELFEDDSISKETLVWYECLGNWKKIEAIEGLF